MAIQSTMEGDDNSVKNSLKAKWNSGRQKQNGENADL